MMLLFNQHERDIIETALTLYLKKLDGNSLFGQKEKARIQLILKKLDEVSIHDESKE